MEDSQEHELTSGEVGQPSVMENGFTFTVDLNGGFPYKM